MSDELSPRAADSNDPLESATVHTEEVVWEGYSLEWLHAILDD